MPGPRGICYVCNSQVDLAGCIPDAEARGALLSIAETVGGEFGRVVIRYVALFAPVKSVMGWGAFRQRTSELGELIDAGRVEWDGITRPATRAMWQEGMETILAKQELRRPLKNHNLLRTITYDIANKADAIQERQREERAKSGAHMAGKQPQAIGQDNTRAASIAAMRELGGDIRTLERLYTQTAARDASDPRLASLQQQIDAKRAKLKSLQH